MLPGPGSPLPSSTTTARFGTMLGRQRRGRRHNLFDFGVVEPAYHARIKPSNFPPPGGGLGPPAIRARATGVKPNSPAIRIIAAAAFLSTATSGFWAASPPRVLEAALCVATLEDTLARYGKPDIPIRVHGPGPRRGCSPTTLAAWMAEEFGATTSSSRGCAAA